MTRVVVRLRRPSFAQSLLSPIFTIFTRNGPFTILGPNVELSFPTTPRAKTITSSTDGVSPDIPNRFPLSQPGLCRSSTSRPVRGRGTHGSRRGRDCSGVSSPGVVGLQVYLCHRFGVCCSFFLISFLFLVGQHSFSCPVTTYLTFFRLYRP